MLDESEIVKGGVYEGGGVCCCREVDAVFPVRGVWFVHWYTMATMAATWKDGRTFHTPNRSCYLRTFARWAQKRIDNQED